MNELHRYTLRREWMGAGGIVNWVMLNPSTADEIADDPTIRKCCGFAKRWGYRGIVVTNLFALRATDPKDMKIAARLDYANAVGTNDPHLIECAKSSELVVAAWGTHGNFLGRAEDVISRVLPGVKWHCIGLTRDGFPVHPCMAKYTEAPLPFSPNTQSPE